MQTISAITAAQSLLNQQGKMHPLLVIELTDMSFTWIRSALKCNVGKCTSPAKKSIACEIRSINSKPQKGMSYGALLYTSLPAVFHLQRKVILHFLFSQLSKCRRQPLSRLFLHLLGRRTGYDTDFDSLFCHLAFKALFESEESSVDGIFKRKIIVVSKRGMNIDFRIHCQTEWLTASPRRSCRSPYSSRSHSPSMPNKIPKGQFAIMTDPCGNPIQQ